MSSSCHKQRARTVSNKSGRRPDVPIGSPNLRIAPSKPSIRNHCPLYGQYRLFTEEVARGYGIATVAGRKHLGGVAPLFKRLTAKILSIFRTLSPLHHSITPSPHPPAPSSRHSCTPPVPRHPACLGSIIVRSRRPRASRPDPLTLPSGFPMAGGFSKTVLLYGHLPFGMNSPSNQNRGQNKWRIPGRKVGDSVGQKRLVAHWQTVVFSSGAEGCGFDPRLAYQPAAWVAVFMDIAIANGNDYRDG